MSDDSMLDSVTPRFEIALCGAQAHRKPAMTISIKSHSATADVTGPNAKAGRGENPARAYAAHLIHTNGSRPMSACIKPNPKRRLYMLSREGRPYVLSARQNCAAMSKALSKLADANQQNPHKARSSSPKSSAKLHLHVAGKENTSDAERFRRPHIHCQILLTLG